jgi:hypothetical protein
LNDVRLTLTQTQLNNIAATVYQKTHSNLFMGTAILDFDGQQINLNYDVAAPPQFNLASQLNAAEARQGLLDAAALAAPHVLSAGTAGISAERDHATIIEGLLAGLPSFTVNLNPVNITFTSGPEKAPMSVSATVQATISSSGGKITFSVLSTSVSSDGTPFQKWLTTKFIQPRVGQIVQQLLAGISLAVPSIPGVPLSPFSVGFASDCLVAAANVSGPQPPAPSGNVPTYGAPFAVALDTAAVQAAASAAIGRSQTFSGSDSSGGSGFNVHYNYSMQAVNPNVSVRGNQIAAQFQVTGSAGAGAEIFWVSIGIGVDISTSPNPTVILNLVPSGNSVAVVAQDALDFSVNVHLSGAIGKLLGWMVDWLLSAIANALKPQLLGYLRGVRFATLNIPTVTQSIGSVPITLTPSVQGVTGDGTYLALVGNLTAS